MKDTKIIITKTTDAYDLITLGEMLGINDRSFKLLLEAYRIKNLSGLASKNIAGFGTPSKYKDKFFKAINKADVQPHKNTNWELTPRGKEVLQVIEENIVILPTQDKKDVKVHLSNIIRKLEICA